MTLTFWNLENSPAVWQSQCWLARSEMQRQASSGSVFLSWKWTVSSFQYFCWWAGVWLRENAFPSSRAEKHSNRVVYGKGLMAASLRSPGNLQWTITSWSSCDSGHGSSCLLSGLWAKLDPRLGKQVHDIVCGLEKAELVTMIGLLGHHSWRYLRDRNIGDAFLLALWAKA